MLFPWRLYDFPWEKCYIWKMETIWKGNELWHTYDLKKREALWVPQIYQNELIGLSLMGKSKCN